MADDSRLNLRLPKQVKAYLKEISWRNKTSVTEYLVALIKNDMEKNIDVVLEIKE